MKLLLIGLSAILITGCATSSLKPQPLNEAVVTLSEHLDKVSISKAFCGGEDVKHYYESTVSYMVSCKDGRSFTLRK